MPRYFIEGITALDANTSYVDTSLHFDIAYMLLHMLSNSY